MHYYAKIHRGEKRLFVQTPNQKEITTKLRAVAPCRWSQTEKAWHFDASNQVFQKLKEAFPEMTAWPKTPQAEITKGTEKEIARDNKPTVRAVQYKPGRYHVIALYNPKLVTVLKGFPYATFDKATKWWSAAIDERQKKALEDFCKTEGLTMHWEDGLKKQTVRPRPQAFEIPNYRTCPDEMLQKLETMRYSPQTIAAYKQLMEEFINYFSAKAIDDITEPEIVAYMRYLVKERNISASYQNQAINAIYPVGLK